MARALHEMVVDAVISRYVMNNTRFADDIAAIGENEKQLQKLVMA